MIWIVGDKGKPLYKWRTSWRWTPWLGENFQNAIFKKILKIPFRRLLVFFLFKISQQIQSLETFKLKQESRYLLEIFSICSSHVCAYLMKKFWPKLNKPASHGPFRPKLWMSLATVFVEISQKEKSWWGSGPIWVPSWKEFQISSKKWRFEIFRTSAPSRYFTMSTL